MRQPLVVNISKFYNSLNQLNKNVSARSFTIPKLNWKVGIYNNNKQKVVIDTTPSTLFLNTYIFLKIVNQWLKEKYSIRLGHIYRWYDRVRLSSSIILSKMKLVLRTMKHCSGLLQINCIVIGKKYSKNNLYMYISTPVAFPTNYSNSNFVKGHGPN